MTAGPLDRLVAIVKRDLGASDVQLLDPGVEAALGEHVLESVMPSGRRIVAVFDSAIEDRDARVRRLEMLVDSFGDTLGRIGTPSRPAPAQSLHGELETLARTADATDALVIDAQSPIVWGAAEDDDISPRSTMQRAPRDNVVAIDAKRDAPRHSLTSLVDAEPANEATEEAPPLSSKRAIEAVRALPALGHLHKGGHLHHSAREDDFGYLARSFAGIYVLILVFDRPSYDELRAERALNFSLPTIERLVLALPPVDPPPPIAGAMAVAVRRRRRR